MGRARLESYSSDTPDSEKPSLGRGQAGTPSVRKPLRRHRPRPVGDHSRKHLFRARFNRISLSFFPMQILFVRGKIHRRRSVIRQNDHPLPEKVMALPIYICIPSFRNCILKKSQGVFQNPLSPNRNTNTPYGNIEHTTNAAAAPMVFPCRGTPTSVGHVAATRVAPQQQGAA